MDGRENSEVKHHQLQISGEQEQYTSPYFPYHSFSLYTPNHPTCLFPTMDFNDPKNAREEVDTGNSNSFTQSEDSSDYSCAKSEGDSSSEVSGDASDGEVSLDELLLDGKTKKKIELLAAMVGVDTTEPAIVLSEVVRVLKALKATHHY